MHISQGVWHFCVKFCDDVLLDNNNIRNTENALNYTASSSGNACFSDVHSLYYPMFLRACCCHFWSWWPWWWWWWLEANSCLHHRCLTNIFFSLLFFIIFNLFAVALLPPSFYFSQSFFKITYHFNLELNNYLFTP